LLVFDLCKFCAQGHTRQKYAPAGVAPTSSDAVDMLFSELPSGTGGRLTGGRSLTPKVVVLLIGAT